MLAALKTMADSNSMNLPFFGTCLVSSSLD